MTSIPSIILQIINLLTYRSISFKILDFLLNFLFTQEEEYKRKRNVDVKPEVELPTTPVSLLNRNIQKMNNQFF